MGHRFRRAERINRLLQEELSEIINRDLKDPRIGFTSIVRVEATNDLRHAKVRVSVMGKPEEKEKTIEGLNSASSFIRETLLHRLTIRRIPYLEFILDENIEYSIHMAELLEKLNKS